MYNDSAPNMKQLFKKKSTWRQALKCGISWACRRSRPLAGRGRSRKVVPRTVRERRICKLQFEYWAPDQTSYLGACAVVLGHWQSVAPFGRCSLPMHRLVSTAKQSPGIPDQPHARVCTPYACGHRLVWHCALPRLWSSASPCWRSFCLGACGQGQSIPPWSAS